MILQPHWNDHEPPLSGHGIKKIGFSSSSRVASSSSLPVISAFSKFVELPKGEELAQTSTTFQWYELEEFEGYRQLGYLRGWAYLANVEFNDTEPTPTAACNAL